MIFYIFCNNRPCTDHSISSYFNTTKQCSIGANACAFFNQCFFEFIFSFYEAAWVNNICKYDGGPQENIILYNNAIIYRHVVLYFNSIANHYIIVDKNILSKITVFSYYTSWHQVTEMPDPGSGAYFRTFNNYRAGMNEERIVFHCAKINLLSLFCQFIVADLLHLNSQNTCH